MAKQTSRVREPLYLIAARLIALVWALMLVHVFVPFTPSPESWRVSRTIVVVTRDIAFLVARHFLLSLWGKYLSSTGF